jgi:predicted metal-dependent peptidase
MLHHCTRGRDFIEPWGNIACDIVTNNLLAKSGFPLHPDWVQPDPKYDGWTFERVYYDLIKDRKTEPEKGKTGGEQGEKKNEAGGEQEAPPATAGDVEPGIPKKYAKAPMDVRKQQGAPEQLERMEQEVEQQVQMAISMGKAPAGVEMAVRRSRVVPKEKWYDHLRRYMQALSQAEMNWARINRRTAALFGIVAPTQYTEQLGEVVIFRDTSGSCFSTATQEKFNSHVGAIIADAKPRKLHVVDFNTAVCKHIEVEPYELEFCAPPKGGGGTSFVPLFSWLEHEGIEPAVVIILTDMYGDFPCTAPEYPVIWTSTRRGVAAPFGELIEIKHEQY